MYVLQLILFLLFLLFFVFPTNSIQSQSQTIKNSIQGINTMANAFFFPQKLTEENRGEGNNNEEKGD